MKVAVIGTEKLASEILKLLPERYIVGVFDSQNLPTAQVLQDAEIVVLSVSPSDVPSVWPVVLESGTIALWETQDYGWPSDMGNRVKAQRTYWVTGCDSFFAKQILNFAKALITSPKVRYGICQFSELWNQNSVGSK